MAYVKKTFSRHLNSWVMRSFRYTGAWGHDGAPSEVEADKGQNLYREFNSYVKRNISRVGLEGVLTSTLSEDEKIKTINNYAQQFSQYVFQQILNKIKNNNK